MTSPDTGGFEQGVPIHDRGPVQQISFGRWVYPLDLAVTDIHIEDIARSLSNQCRYLGHVKKFYSVAQHSVLVSRAVPAEHALWGLLHDATEAYIGDISRPVKNCLQKLAPGVLYSFEESIAKIIAQRFDLCWPMPNCVELADNTLLATERRDVLDPSMLDWGPLPAPLPRKIYPISARAAEIAFLTRFRILTR